MEDRKPRLELELLLNKLLTGPPQPLRRPLIPSPLKTDITQVDLHAPNLQTRIWHWRQRRPTIVLSSHE